MVPKQYENAADVEIFWYITVILASISTAMCLLLIIDLIRIRIIIIPKFDSVTFISCLTIYASFFICSLFAALFRSNIIINIPSFPICTHLMIGIFQLFWCMGKLFTTLYYIYRLFIIFRHSAFRLRKKILMSFVIFTVISGCIGIVLVPLVTYNNLVLAISKNNYKHCQIGVISDRFKSLLITEGILHGIVNMILIYLFVSRLWKLVESMIPNSAINKDTLPRLQSNTGRSNSTSNSQTYNTFNDDDSRNYDEDNIDEESKDDDRLPNIIENEQSYQQEEISRIEQSREREISKRKSSLIIRIAKQSLISYSDRDFDRRRYLSDESSQKRVEMMARLMSKQTILVILYISSTSLIFFGQIVYESLGYLVPFDIIINIICIWLSLKYSDNIWNLLVKGCGNVCCCFCYCFKCCQCNDDNNNVIIQPQDTITIIDDDDTDNGA